MYHKSYGVVQTLIHSYLLQKNTSYLIHDKKRETFFLQKKIFKMGLVTPGRAFTDSKKGYYSWHLLLAVIVVEWLWSKMVVIKNPL